MDEAAIHRNKLPNKTYMSPAVSTRDGSLRIASKVIDSEGLHYATVKKEVVLRHTANSRTEIVAKFLESDRQLRVVTLQAFSPKTGAPHQTHFSFIGSEVSRLLEFFENIASLEFDGPGKVNLSDKELRKLVVSREQAKSLVLENQDVFAEALQADLTKEDVIALGYRKRQLSTFARLLHEADYFEQVRVQKGARGDEALWQLFFEKNRWVFGYGLSYFFVSGFDGKKLEQVVQGHNLLERGKRADGLMKTRGIINSLCFVEIKTHNTPLLESSAYRPGCWAPSRDLTGAVAQVQGTVSAAMQHLHGLIQPTHDDGTPTGEFVFNYKPRAFIVIGSTGEFSSSTGANAEKVRSFELYRNSLDGIDILTFDELYERSKFIINSAESPSTQRG